VIIAGHFFFNALILMALCAVLSTIHPVTGIRFSRVHEQ